MIGNRCVIWRTISNEAEPDPIIIPARSSSTGTPYFANEAPVFALEARCWL